MVSHGDSAQADEGADAALRRAGDPRYLIWLAALVISGAAALVLGHMVVRAVLLRLRRPLWLFHRFTLARMRPRHGVPDAVMNDAVYQSPAS